MGIFELGCTLVKSSDFHNCQILSITIIDIPRYVQDYDALQGRQRNLLSIALELNPLLQIFVRFLRKKRHVTMILKLTTLLSDSRTNL